MRGGISEVPRHPVLAMWSLVTWQAVARRAVTEAMSETKKNPLKGL